MRDKIMKVPARPAHTRFSQTPSVDVPRSQFDLSHGIKTTFDAGYLIPIYVDEALPGDTFNVRLNAFARLATPLKPVMDNMYLDTFFFAVPYRLVWQNWQKFNGQQDSPGDSTDYLVPVVGAVAAVTPGSLADYMGLPPGLDPAVTLVSSLPFRAYSLIWNQWFRDENLQAPRAMIVGDGPDPSSVSFSTLARRGKRHDYFTSALPWPQKGVAVSLPLGTTAPVTAKAAAYGSGYVTVKGQDNNYHLLSDANIGPNYNLRLQVANDGASNANMLYADLAAATAASINDIRRAFQVQRLLERDARGGTRYIEIIKSHFGVSSLDARLQRSEYLGGGTSFVNVSPVAQTSSTDATTPQANLSAIGTVSLQGHGFVKSFTEHCILIGLASVRADLTYQMGVERMWSRRTRYDFYWPALSMIGEQAILNKEIFVSGGVPVDDAVFGYQERYAEYRYRPSRISGLFRSNVAGSIDMWHLAQDFAATPALNSAFIEEDPPIDRVIAVPSEPHFLFDGWFNIKAARPMPVYGVPGMMDHF